MPRKRATRPPFKDDGQVDLGKGGDGRPIDWIGGRTASRFRELSTN
jgi:hypothetical protein